MIGDDEKVHGALCDELARLTGNARFTVAEFGATGATVFRVRRDEHGTPQPKLRRLTAADMAGHDAFYRDYAPAFIAATSASLPAEVRALLPGADGVPVYDCPTPLETHLLAAIRDSPLVLGYELAVLKRVPAGRSGAGHIYLSGHHLFPPGVRRGDRVKVTVRCEPTDGDGTAFAVLTRDQRPDVAPNSQELRPFQIQSAVLPPGRHELTAVLDRPGQVLLEGLPAALGPSARSWDELRSLVPDQLAAQDPVHLICLIEVCGGDQDLRLRIDRLEELISEAETGAGQLLVSVIAYGPHAVAWSVTEEPIAVQAWVASSAEAVAGLRRLAGRQPDEREYRRAAQLECALREIAVHLTDDYGRPVLVTAGGRPPHPRALDTDTLLIPCPDWVNWIPEFNRLGQLPGIAFGALRDRRWRGDIWQALGRDAWATVDDAVNMTDFAADLGLIQVAQAVPFPFID
jgi:hypothetical protein